MVVRRALGVLLPIGLSLVLTLIAGEILFRAAFPQPLYAVTHAPWGFWHIPSTCVDHAPEPWHEGEIFVGREFRTRVCYNALGLRERELPLAKAPATQRVLVLGDSYGEGMQVAFEETVGQVLEVALNAEPGRVAAPSTRARAAGGDPVRPAPGEPEKWVVTRAILDELRRRVTADGATLLVANVHYAGDDLALRSRWFEAAGIPWVDLAVADEAEHARTHYRYDTHWNAAGHERAARLIASAVRARGLLGAGRVEVVNASMSALSTCKELQVYDAIGRRYSPDLVVLIYTANDERNLADADMCSAASDGSLTVRPRTFSVLEMAIRDARGWLRSRSHLYAWVSDRLVRVGFGAGDQIPLRDR